MGIGCDVTLTPTTWPLLLSLFIICLTSSLHPLFAPFDFDGGAFFLLLGSQLLFSVSSLRPSTSLTNAFVAIF